jgi:hypothetical protein
LFLDYDGFFPSTPSLLFFVSRSLIRVFYAYD